MASLRATTRTSFKPTLRARSTPSCPLLLQQWRSISCCSPLLADTSAPAPPKVPVSLISQIRSQRPGTPLSLARTALLASELSIPKALEWIAQQTAESGQVKQAKLSSRVAEQGLVGISLLNDGLTSNVNGTIRVAMVEVRCETDFVARTDEFRSLVEAIAHSVAYFAEPSKDSQNGQTSTQLIKRDLKQLEDVPLVPSPSSSASSGAGDSTETISSAITSTISRLGENITLARVSSLVIDPPSLRSLSTRSFISTYLHGALPSTTTAGSTTFQAGTLASLLVTSVEAGSKIPIQELTKLGRQLARQVVAYPTTAVRSSTSAPSSAANEDEGPSTILYEQPVLTIVPSPSEGIDFVPNQAKVGEVLELWSAKKGGKVQVVDLARWVVGEEVVP